MAWGKVNRPIEAAAFDGLHQRMLAYLRGKELFVQDCWTGADPAYRMPIRIITEKAWHSLFVRHMFIDEPDPAKRLQHDPQFTVIDIPSFTATPATDKTNSEVFILLNFAKKLVIIGGTNYAGEMKKSIFTVMNYLLPLRDVMPMHCSANVGARRRRRAVLRAVRHRQDHALERSEPPAHRRRRAWVEQQRRVQLRGRLLREDDPAFG